MRIEDSLKTFTLSEFPKEISPSLLAGVALTSAVGLAIIVCLKKQSTRNWQLRRRSTQLHTQEVKQQSCKALLNVKYFGKLLEPSIEKFKKEKYESVFNDLDGVLNQIPADYEQRKCQIFLYELYGASAYHLGNKVSFNTAIAALCNIILYYSENKKSLLFAAYGAYARLLVLDGNYEQALSNLKKAEENLTEIVSQEEAKNLYEDQFVCVTKLGCQTEAVNIEEKLQKLTSANEFNLQKV